MEKAPVRQVIELSGLPQESANDFLMEAFAERGISWNGASLEDLRHVLADLLQDLILQSEEH